MRLVGISANSIVHLQVDTTQRQICPRIQRVHHPELHQTAFPRTDVIYEDRALTIPLKTININRLRIFIGKRPPLSRSTFAYDFLTDW